MGNEKRVWNRVAKIYDKFMKKDKVAYKKIVELIKQSSLPTDKVLELGTATGIIAFGLANYLKKIEATDFSLQMINVCKQKAQVQQIKNINFMVQDACKLSYKDNSFNKIIISNVLHIMPNPQKALQEVHRVLTPNGILYAPTFVHANNLKASIFSKVTGLIGFKAYNKWSEHSYHNFIKNNGFEIINSSVIKASFPISYVECKQQSISKLDTHTSQ